MAPFSSLATISQDSVITAAYLNQNKSNTDDLNARLSRSAITDIPNGGFEVDSDSDGDSPKSSAPGFMA